MEYDNYNDCLHAANQILPRLPPNLQEGLTQYMTMVKPIWRDIMDGKYKKVEFSANNIRHPASPIGTLYEYFVASSLENSTIQMSNSYTKEVQDKVDITIGDSGWTVGVQVKKTYIKSDGSINLPHRFFSGVAERLGLVWVCGDIWHTIVADKTELSDFYEYHDSIFSPASITSNFTAFCKSRPGPNRRGKYTYMLINVGNISSHDRIAQLVDRIVDSST